ncbi:tyrosine-type recombinase/integrase [Helicobacter bilis]|uniref:tyrosine-type recombinase/integrase n=2 Tax=Helicobacter bilis TaxID=37372 RepID=UPI000A3E7543|nr:site-specific integrase [Helicobacter bilis]MCI7410417.1 site-specific integrase [Helicobacter bilis]MDY4399778.1 site-specific integrase [Helicobacter bilis]
MQTTLGNFKHAKIRGKYIQVHACINNVRYRFSTRLEVSAKNLLWVENNYMELIQKHELEVEQNNTIGLDIATYGREILEAHCEHRKENTYIRYLNVFKKYIVSRIGYLEIAEIKPKNAREIFSNFNDITATNKSLVLNLLKLIFTHAVIDGLVSANPFLHLKCSTQRVIKEDRNKPFSMQEMKQILSKCDNALLQLYLFIAFFTGMRPNEILALNVKDIDLSLGNIYVNKSVSHNKLCTTKTNAARYVEITTTLKQYLTSVLKDKSGYIFLDSKKGFVNEKSIAYNFKKLLKKLDIQNNTLYSTRHTFASLMLQSGEDMHWVSKQLGHKDLSTTLQYYVKYIKQDKERGQEFNRAFEDLEKQEVA